MEQEGGDLPDYMYYSSNYSYIIYDDYTTYVSFYWPYVINSISFKGIAPFGLLMNTIFLFVVCRVRAMHTAINIHLSNLAAADIFFLAIMEFRFATGITSFALSVLNYVAYMASMLFVTVAALGRAFAINRPFRAREIMSKSCAARVAVGVWTLSLLFSIGYNLLMANPESVDQNALDIFYLFINPTFLCVNVALYICMICGLHRSMQQITDSSVSQRRMVQMLAINTAVFFSFHLAVTSFNLYSMFNKMDQSAMQIGFALLFMLLTLNSSINPLVYSTTNVDYRAAVVSAFWCDRCACHNRDDTQTQSTGSNTTIRMTNLRTCPSAI